MSEAGDEASDGSTLDADIRRLAPEDDRRGFSCGVPSLDTYLGTQAGQDARRGLAVVYVLIDAGRSGRIRGYFTLSMCSVELVGLPAEVARGLGRYPQVPSVLIGRLAVARDEQRLGLGRRLLAEALLRVRALSREAGCAMVLVDALDERAAGFYLRAGFVMLAVDADASTWPRQLVLPLAWLDRGKRA